MLGDKKKTLTQILGPREEKVEGAPEKGALHAIADDLISAVSAKDVEGVVSALRAAYLECGAEKPVEE